MKNLKYFKITPDTTLEEIEKQYRDLAKKYHPNTKSEHASKEKFQELLEEKERILQYLKYKAEQSGDMEQARQISKLITILTNEFVKDKKYRPLVREGLKLIIRLFN